MVIVCNLNLIINKVIVTKKNNKNTYIKVKEDLTINVSTNYLATKHYIKGLLDSERDYLRRVLRKLKLRAEKEADFYYLGKKYDIIWVPFSKVEVDGLKIYAKDEKQLEKWLKFLLRDSNIIMIYLTKIFRFQS